MSGTVIASDGNNLPLSSLPIVLGHTGDLVTSFTVEYDFYLPSGATQTRTYRQTLTYTGDLLTEISGWEYVP